MIARGDGHGGSGVGQEGMLVSSEISSRTWWVSPADSVHSGYFSTLVNYEHVYSASATITTGYGTGVGNTGTSTQVASTGASAYYTPAAVIAVIDTEQKFIRVDPYSPPILSGSNTDTGIDNDNNVETHSHWLSNMILTDMTTDYSYGNTSGQGFQHGLGSAGHQLPVLFGQINSNQGGVTSYGVGMELNSGTFSLVTTQHKPIPNVRFEPNRTVELVPQFHKVKYIIKAF